MKVFSGFSSNNSFRSTSNLQILSTMETKFWPKKAFALVAMCFALLYELGFLSFLREHLIILPAFLVIFGGINQIKPSARTDVLQFPRLYKAVASLVLAAFSAKAFAFSSSLQRPEPSRDIKTVQRCTKTIPVLQCFTASLLAAASCSLTPLTFPCKMPFRWRHG